MNRMLTASGCYMFLANKLFGVNKRKVVFISFGGKSYSDNPRAISEKLHELHPEFEIVWLFNKPAEKRALVPGYVRCVAFDSRAALKELATAKFWVDNATKARSTYKSKKQVYIQTWHGDRGFKKVLYDSPFVTNDDLLIENEICDLYVAGSDSGERKARTAFRYSGEVMKYGCPRNDLLVENDRDKARAVRSQLQLEGKTRILLYAPTLRRAASKGRGLQPLGEIDLLATLQALENKTGEPWICLVRAHSSVLGLAGIPGSSAQIVDVTSYEDMGDLLLISDFLITDYSASAGDFALLNRPVILFQADREDYIKKDRSFYFDLDESPFMIAKNQDDLVSLIAGLDMAGVPRNCKEILDFYGAVETGRASEKVVEYIQDKYLKS